MHREFRNLLAASLATMTLAASPVAAQTIGVSISNFDDNFLTMLREAMDRHAAEVGDVELQIEDAQRDVGRQLSQIENFVAAGVDGIIVGPIDSDSTNAMTSMAENAGVPLVFVNNLPINLDELPDNQAFVGSNEYEAGQMQAEETCRLLGEQGKEESGASILLMLGDLSNQATRLRTQAVKDVIDTPECAFMTIADEQTAMWMRTEALNLMSNWLTAGIEFDAVLANNDEMAIGAIQALKTNGVDMDDVIVGGIDATPDALEAVAMGDMDVTVFQDAVGQGNGAVDAVIGLINGEEVDQKIFVPFLLVTPDNLSEFRGEG